MANGASSKFKIPVNAESVTGTFTSETISVPADADDIGISTSVDSGTVAGLTVDLEQTMDGGTTWVAVAGAQTTNTSGGEVAFASAPSTGTYRINFSTVTTPSTLVCTVKIIYGQKS